jgi:hypothetical protein
LEREVESLSRRLWKGKPKAFREVLAEMDQAFREIFQQGLARLRGKVFGNGGLNHTGRLAGMVDSNTERS